ncbi:MAG: hypothetical protein H0U49_01910 [Parachlamydiaceae bacterium]|nr:hypothetical protein [Parachlamydiaceae bacterium]
MLFSDTYSPNRNGFNSNGYNAYGQLKSDFPNMPNSSVNPDFHTEPSPEINYDAAKQGVVRVGKFVIESVLHVPMKLMHPFKLLGENMHASYWQCVFW